MHNVQMTETIVVIDAIIEMTQFPWRNLAKYG